jgi:hypothetical protein
MSDGGFDDRISGLDIVLFSQILSQTTDADKRSLLAVQACTRDCLGEYVYLEIGSYLGGSIQPHLLDSTCKKIYSIDKRPWAQPDERDPRFEYPDNSTERMLTPLRTVNPRRLSKVECLDGDTRSISPSLMQDAPNLCFVDGEHTLTSVVADFDFCSKVCAVGATVVFHDAQIVFRGLRSVVSKLKKAGREFTLHAMSDSAYVVCLDRSLVPAGLAKFTSQAREDDLWSFRNDLRHLKWRAKTFKQGASNFARQLLGAN